MDALLQLPGHIAGLGKVAYELSDVANTDTGDVARGARVDRKHGGVRWQRKGRRDSRRRKS